jgi:hypothetical protein
MVLDNFGKHLTFENFEKLKYHKLKKKFEISEDLSNA